MGEDSKLTIGKIIVHILDNSLHMPVLSQFEHPENDEICEFVEKHICRIIKDDDLKKAQFTDEFNQVRSICEALREDSTSFAACSAEIAGALFGLMQKHADIPSADLLCSLLELDNINFLAILKMNYKSSYIHYVETTQDGSINSIIKQRTALPGDSQKVDECALINLNDLSIKLLEKKYDINGEKLYYFSTMFLKCSGDISDKQKVRTFKKANENFSKEFFEQDPTKTAAIKAAAAESFEQKSVIDIEEVAETAFKQNPDMQKAYIEHMEKAGFTNRMVNVNEKLAEKTFTRQRIKTDTGIEINIPVSFYNEEKVEFINNIDGTISILIKNAGRITDI